MRTIRLLIGTGLSLLTLLAGQDRAQFARTVAAQSMSNRPVCPTFSHSRVRCLAHVLTDSGGEPLHSSASAPGGYGPGQFHAAYNLPCSVNGKKAQAVCSTPTQFGGQVIAIVDSGSHPSIEADLAVYDSAYGIPSCTVANGCLTIVNQYGQTTPLPAPDISWGLEIALDVETAHEICQTCKILLVEAADDLLGAEDTAAAMGATVISNSYTWGERTDAASLDPHYNHPGVAVVAATGDSGYGPQYPADSPYVVAVGGTTLTMNANRYVAESAWSGAGSGCSLTEFANTWQTSRSDWPRTGCGAYRSVADVSADADPATGAAVYDSYGYGGWLEVGGTSLSTPLIAGVFALAGGVPSGTNAQSIPYARFSTRNDHDITTGSNGTCTTSSCNAGPGYDGPTGLGSPNGLAGY